MKRTLEIINQLKSNGLVKDYAIGGGMGAMFYTEPIFTYDLDIFIILPQEKTGLITLSSIFEYLEKNGATWKGEHIIIGGFPVQFIAATGLELEAIVNSKSISYQGVKTNVISPEYLIPMFLQAGRAKDLMKIKMLLEQATIDTDKLMDVLTRYKLADKFRGMSK